VAIENYDVFISYSRADARYAADIDSGLRQEGLRTFFDRSNLVAGLPWVRALEESIGAAKAAVILLGRSGLGNTQQYERELAFVRQTGDPTFPVIPVLLPEAHDPPFNFLRVATWVDFSHVTKILDAPDEFQRLLTAVKTRLTLEPGRLDLCPYRGLDAFREEDSAFFVGRGSAHDPESPLGQLTRKVREHPFVMVVGRSGTGKSSLIHAGLLPALRRERATFWNLLSIRPGPTPLRALAAAFNPRTDDVGAAEYATKITNEAHQLRTGDPGLLSYMIRQELDHAEGKPDRLVLYIDQWEELYAQAPPSSDRERAAEHATDVKRFIDLLLAAARAAPVAVVATVRADFYDPLIGHPELQSLLPERQITLGPMSRSELERTIVEPANKVGLAFDPPSLVERILDEAGEDEGMLPLLQYALKESWALRKGKMITADSYTRSGGVREAIRTTAERTFEALSPAEQQAARQLFLRLVTPGEGQEDTRARALMPTELAQRRIVEQFADARTRLLVTGSDRALRATVEVAHEALIRTWPRLRGWIDASREKLRARAAIRQTQAEWEQHGQRDDMLLPLGFQLERARALLADPGDTTIDDIKEVVALSLTRGEAEQQRRKDAEINHDHAQADFLGQLAETKLAGGEIDSALRLAAQGTRIDLGLPSDVAKASKATAALAIAVQAKGRSRLIGYNLMLNPAASSPTGSRIVMASHDQTARNCDAPSAMEIAVLRGHHSYLQSAAFSSDGSRIVTASHDETARIWDSVTAKEIAVLRGHSRYLQSAAFSPDGSRVVAASVEKTAHIWDAASAKEIAVLRGHASEVKSAAFSIDGSRIVTASSDKTARIWDAATTKEISILRGHDDIVFSAAFSPDTSRVVTASADNTARIWDAVTAKEIVVLRGHGGPIASAVFNPDGSRIVTASYDMTARVWDAATGKEITVLRGHANEVKSAAFSPDGSRVVTASIENAARIWDPATAKEISILRGHDGPVASAVFNPDGSRIVTASYDMTARIWDARFQTMSAKGLLAEAFARLADSTKLTRDAPRWLSGRHAGDRCVQ
jgi:hypothetical protein